MRNLIFQYYIGNPDKSVEYSVNDFKEYGKKYNAEYVFKNKPFISFADELKKHEIYYNKLIAIIQDKSLDEYDNILYADTDVVIDDFNHNIFDLIADDTDVVLIGDDYLVPIYYLKGHWKEMLRIFSDEYLEPEYFVNSGVMLWTKKGRLKARKEFLNFERWLSYPQYNVKNDDEFYLNAMLTINNFNIQYLSEEWNWREDNMTNRFNEQIERNGKPIFHHFLFGSKKNIEKHKNGK